MVSAVRLGLKRGEIPPILQSTVFHGVLLIACEGGGVYMWRETEWVRLPMPKDESAERMLAALAYEQQQTT